MKTGVLVHGCNLNIENWRHVAWGDPPNEPGRIPQGLLVACQFQAECIVFGTGASKKEFRLGDSPQTGRELLEAEYSLEYLRLHFDGLRRFDIFSRFVPESKSDSDWQRHKQSLMDRIVLDTKSQNTAEEIFAAATIFLERGIERMVLVSSPSHIVRCLRDAASIFSENENFARFRSGLFASPSVTCYEGTTPGDVVVVEPPHRPDRHVVPTHRRIQRMLTLQKLDQQERVRLIEEFDDLLQRYEHKYFNG